MSDKHQAIINELRGTCENFDAVAERNGVDPMDTALCDAIDAEIFKCAECGWWCEMHEEVSAFADLDEWTCRECAQSNHGYEGYE